MFPKTLKEFEQERIRAPNNLSAKILRIGASLKCLQEIYEQVQGEEQSVAIANERAREVFHVRFNDFRDPNELAAILDRICTDLEPENGFDTDFTTLYRTHDSNKREELLENQSSSIFIVRNLAGYLNVTERQAGKILRAFRIFKFISCFVAFLGPPAVILFTFPHLIQPATSAPTPAAAENNPPSDWMVWLQQYLPSWLVSGLAIVFVLVLLFFVVGIPTMILLVIWIVLANYLNKTMDRWALAMLKAYYCKFS